MCRAGLCTHSGATCRSIGPFRPAAIAAELGPLLYFQRVSRHTLLDISLDTISRQECPYFHMDNLDLRLVCNNEQTEHDARNDCVDLAKGLQPPHE
ncbi:MAG: DUF1826 domain-containing protein [Chromatiaceae bacterium]|nr:MAG: DUF1826 domain-containing protein [Chromatiaceae bacterium]